MVRNLWSEGRGLTLLVVSLGGFLSIGTQMTYPMLLPHLRAAYGMSLSMGGLLLSTLFISYGVFQLPSGFIADRFGEGNVMTVGLLISAFGVVLTIVFNSLTSLFLSTIILGVGISIFTISRMSMLSDIYSDNLGLAAGFTFGMDDSGQAILPPIAGILAITIAWQVGLGFTVPLFVLLALWVWYVVPRLTSSPTIATEDLSTKSVTYLGKVIITRPVLFGSALMLPYVALWTTFSGFYPEYLIGEKGLSQSQVSLIFGFLFALGILIKPIGGGLFDRFGARKTVITFALFPGLGFVFLSMADNVIIILSLTAMISFFLGVGTIAMSTIMKSLPTDVRGTALGVLRSIIFSLGTVTPAIFGAIADRGYFDEAIMGLALFPAIMILVVLTFPEE